MITKTLLGGALLAIVAGAFFSSTQDDPLKKADNAFERKEYAAALAAYQTAAKTARARRRARTTSGSASA